jgi:hypothetical protein
VRCAEVEVRVAAVEAALPPRHAPPEDRNEDGYARPAQDQRHEPIVLLERAGSDRPVHTRYAPDPAHGPMVSVVVDAP